MRSYSQYCAVAKALDVVGDRWTLLIVRELMLRGACRYTDIRDGLPGIASNLLAQRLRELEGAGVIERRDAPPPVAATLYELTVRGAELAPALHELGRWGIAYMAEGPAVDDEFRSRWLSWPAEQFLSDHEPHKPPVRLAIDTGQDPVAIEASAGEVRVTVGEDAPADATLSGSPHAVLGLLSGRLDLKSARDRGLEYRGSTAVIARLQPLATT